MFSTPREPYGFSGVKVQDSVLIPTQGPGLFGHMQCGLCWQFFLCGLHTTFRNLLIFIWTCFTTIHYGAFVHTMCSGGSGCTSEVSQGCLIRVKFWHGVLSKKWWVRQACPPSGSECSNVTKSTLTIHNKASDHLHSNWLIVATMDPTYVSVVGAFFLPGTELVLLPTRIVPVFIKHNHGAGLDSITQVCKHIFCG